MITRLPPLPRLPRMPRRRVPDSTPYQVNGAWDFPIAKAVSVPVSLEGVEVWRPPSPFQDGSGTLNFQFIVRMKGQQFVLWWVQNEEPRVEEVRQLLHSMK